MYNIKWPLLYVYHLGIPCPVRWIWRSLLGSMCAGCILQRNWLKYSRNCRKRPMKVCWKQLKLFITTRATARPRANWVTVLTFSWFTVKRGREYTGTSEKQNRNSVQWRSFRTWHGHFKEKGVIAQSRYSTWSHPSVCSSSPGGVKSVKILVRRRVKDFVRV